MRGVSDSDKAPLDSLLTSFSLGPAWARAGSAERGSKSRAASGAGNENSASRERRGSDRRDQGRKFDEPRADRGRGGRFNDRREAPVRVEEIQPAEGVRVVLLPESEAVHLIGKEIHQVARVYPLYDVAKILLSERGRCRALFESIEPQVEFYVGKIQPSIFSTREEAVRHLWDSELKQEFLDETVVEVDPPSGNFQLIARCGMSGDLLGPPNFHGYQINLRRLHRERFSHIPFESYSARVKTERGEEVVNEWLEKMKSQIRWKLKHDEGDSWIEDRAEAERVLVSRCFDAAFDVVRRAEVNAAIEPKHLSPGLFASLKAAGNHARSHPAVLIPSVCKAVEAEHLPVFKRQGKLFTGPARPLPLPVDTTLAERPGIMVEWIRNHKPAKLAGLWKAVLPEGSTAPPAEFAADLFWLLTQGHILLFTDDTLVVQEVRDPSASTALPEGSAPKKKNKKKKPQQAAVSNDTAVTAEEAPEVTEAVVSEDVTPDVSEDVDVETSEGSDDFSKNVSDKVDEVVDL